MWNRFKNLFESIVYAGMKPGARSSEGAPAAKQGWFARLLNGPSPSDPLYLTNQTMGQRVRRLLLVASPMIVVIVGGLIVIAVSSPKTRASHLVTAAEVRSLPEFNERTKLAPPPDLEVSEVRLEHTAGNRIVGNLRNKSTHAIDQAVVVFDLEDPNASALGGVTITELNLPAGGTRAFHKSIDQKNATFALVRELNSK